MLNRRKKIARLMARLMENVNRMRIYKFALSRMRGGLSTLFQTNFFRLFSRYCTGV